MRRVLGVLLVGILTGSAVAQVAGPNPTLPMPTMLPKIAPPASLRGAASAPAQPRAEDLHTFSSNDLRVVWNQRRWQLVSGAEVIKDFGSREQEARQALHVIQELGLNQHAVIGSPSPVMEYWLADGKAPGGLVRAGMRAVSLDPGALRVEQTHGLWCLRDRTRVLFTFGQNGAEAQQALAVIRKYHFDQIGLVGQSTPSMYVFMSRTPDSSTVLPPTHGAGSSSRHLTPQRFSRLVKNADGSPRFEKSSTASTNSGLEGLAVPAVPPLANHGKDRVEDQPRPFHWQAQPGNAQAPVVSPLGDRVPFDWRQVVLLQEQGEWRLKAGGMVLANFGPSAHDARLALAALRHYRFVEQHRLGGNQAYLTYYLANNAAPRGVMIGVTNEEFKPDQLELKQVESGFALCQGQRVVVRLRDKEDDGRKLLDSIKRNRCDRICKIGEPGKEAMTFLIRSR